MRSTLGRPTKIRWVSAVALTAGLMGCAGSSGEPKEPVRTVAGPPLLADFTPPDAGVAAPAPVPAPPPVADSTPSPAPLPVTTRLARGTGSPADAALQAGDAA